MICFCIIFLLADIPLNIHTKEAGLEINFKDLALKAGQYQGTVGDSEPGGGSFTPDSETADSNRLCDIIKYKIQIKPQKHIVYA